MFDDVWGFDDLFDFDYSDIIDETITEQYKNTPVQNVYFFKRGMNAWSNLFLSCVVFQQKKKTETKLQ